MSSWTDDPIAEVRSRADIVEVIGQSVVLKRSGRNYVGLCPFHGERTPSFNVNPERQIFRCFGCGEGGDVFTFLMKAQHQTFPEALKTLADRYGVVLPDRRPDDDERTRLRELNELAANFYRAMLEHPSTGVRARTYLAERGVEPAMIKRFGLGFAPDRWDALERHLAAAAIPVALAEKAALIRPRQGGQGHYDYFRNRLIFPIANEAGQVVGFGARAIDPADEPKYLNSPETALYHKGQVLYGLDQARDTIRSKDGAVLMEGYMDVITAHAHGFTETVGVLGTALTPAQARMLLRYTPSKRIVIAFDADKAGQQAAERGLATLTDVTQGVGLEARVLAVPEGKDPDAYLRKEGGGAFKRLLDAAPVLFEFLLERAIAAHDVTTPDGRARAVAACVPVIRQIGNYVTQNHYVEWLSRRLALREESLRLEIGKGMRHNGAPSRGVQLNVKKLSAREAERLLLFFLVERPDLRGGITERLGTLAFDPLHQELRGHIASLTATGTLAWTDLLGTFAGREDIQKIISEMMFADYEARAPEEVGKVVEDCINTLLLDHGQREVEQLRERLNREGPGMDPAAMREMTTRFKEWVDYCVQLKHKRSNISSPT